MHFLADQLDSLIENESRNEEVVINGFMDRYDVSFDEAKDILNETKKFLSLAADAEDKNMSLFIDKPLAIIDEMWHTFILHTKQYVDFCFLYFNRFIHHRPTSSEEKKEFEFRLKENPNEVIDEAKKKLSSQYSLIYDKFGSDTLLKWYDEWATKYSPEYINKIKKAS